MKAKVKGKSEDIEVKSKGRKGESGRCEVFFCGGVKAVKAKNMGL